MCRSSPTLSLRKTYAPFFEWADKPQKEVGVAEHLLACLNRERMLGWHSLRSQLPDPPDCVCTAADGAAIAIEVAEVVCSEAAARTARGENVMRKWEPGDATAHIRELLQKKDAKTFLGGGRTRKSWLASSQMNSISYTRKCAKS